MFDNLEFGFEDEFDSAFEGFDLFDEDFDIADEGFFGDPEHTVAAMLNTVRDNIASRVTTVEQADSLINQISEEAVRFNLVLNEMADAIRAFQRGDITKEDMMSTCTAGSRQLKEQCKTLQLADGITEMADDEICEDEIAMIREFIIGCKSIVEEHRAKLAGEEGADQAGKAGTIVHAAESLVGQLEALTYDMGYDDFDDFEEAFEGLDKIKDVAGAGIDKIKGAGAKVKGGVKNALDSEAAMKIKNSAPAQKANELYKKAKELVKAGADKAKITALINKAKGLYEQCLNKVKSIKGNGSVKEFFLNRIDACKTFLLKIAGKIKGGFKDTMGKLKSIRKGAATESLEYSLDALAFAVANESYYEADDFEAVIESNVNIMLINDGFEDEIL